MITLDTALTTARQSLTSSHYLEGEDELRGYSLVFDALRSAAFSPRASAERIRKLLDEAQ